MRRLAAGAFVIGTGAVLGVAGKEWLEENPEVLSTIIEVLPIEKRVPPLVEMPAMADDVYLARKTEIEITFEATKNYWVNKGMDIESVTLNIVEGEETVECGDGIFDATIDTPAFCPAIGAVLVPEYVLKDSTLDANITDDPQGVNFLEFAVAHEVGHRVQLAERRFGAEPPESGSVERVFTELQADCYAGKSLAAMAPMGSATLEQAPILSLPGDEDHGTMEQRAASLSQGYYGLDC